MGHSYFVETSAEAERAVEELVAKSFKATVKAISTGYQVTVDSGPSVTIEELLLRVAPSVRRLDL